MKPARRPERAGRFWLWLAALPLLLCLCPPGLAAPPPPPVAVTNAGQQPILGHLSVLRDFGGRMDFAAVRQAEGDFEPTPGNDPAFGYHPGTIWIRFELANPAATRAQRWLEQAWVFQEHVDLYLVDATGNVAEFRNGAAVPREARPLPSRAILFPIDLAPGQSLEAYLALSGKASSTVKLRLWQPAAYADAGRLQMAIKYLALGSSFIVVVFSFMAWQARREPLLLLGGLGEFLLLPNMMILDGFALGLLPAGSGLWQTRLSTALAGLYFTCHILFARGFFELRTASPRLHGALGGLAWAMLLFTLAASALIAPQLVVLPLLVVMGVLTFVALAASRRGSAAAKAYLWSWGFLWATVAFRLLQLLGWTPFIPAYTDAHIIGIVTSGLALAYALFLDTGAMRAAAEAAQAALIRERAEENVRLEAAVRAQTRELREAKEKAEEGSRAKTAFLSMMSHELRAPLHTIIGYSQLLAGDADRELRRRLGIVEQNGRDLLHLIDGILEFSRNERPSTGLDLQAISLADLAQRLLESHRLLAARRRNEFSAHLDPALPDWVEADESRLIQALGNLLSNACKYTEGGRIALRIEPATPAPRRFAPDGPYAIRFQVIDTGIGVPAGSEAAIFKSFFRVNPNSATPGAGLGLSIAQQSVAAMGGTIEYRRPPDGGSGSIFSFQLTLNGCPPAPDLGDSAVDIDGYGGPRRTLLIADDNRENRRFLTELCKRWGFEILEAADGEDALRQIMASPAPVAAALVDQFMPRSDGWTFLRELRQSKLCPDLPVILISAAPLEKPAGLPAGIDFDAILLKPALGGTLASVLHELLGVEWHRKPKPLAKPPAAEIQPRLRLPPEEIEQFRDMVNLGRISALKQWARRIAKDYPECEAAMNQIDAMCDDLDLAGLGHIAAHWMGTD